MCDWACNTQAISNSTAVLPTTTDRAARRVRTTPCLRTTGFSSDGDKNMTLRKSIGIGAALLLSAAVAHADPCKMSIESNDVMQYSAREMVVPTGCTEVEV